MKTLFLTSFIYAFPLSAQHYTGYGRGIDFESSPRGGSTDNVIFIIGITIFIILGIVAIFLKARERHKLSTGEYIKVIRDGYIVARPCNDKYSQLFEVIQTWKFDEFRKHFTSIKYNIKHTNLDRKELESISCNSETDNVIIYVRFECGVEHIYDIIDYNVAKIKGGSYLLYRK